MSEWFTVKEIDNKTFAISEYKHWEEVHSYLLIGKKEAALIDTGLGIGNIKEIVDDLTTLPIKVLTTHAHWDHIGGHEYFDQIFVHDQDAGWLNESYPIPLEDIRKSVIEGVNNHDLPRNFSIEDYKIFNGELSGMLVDEDVIDIGDRVIKVLHTPGHSPGHLCFFEERTGYLFTGDLIYKGTLFAFYKSTNPELYYQSVSKLRDLEGVRMILPAHNDLDIKVGIIGKVYDAFKEINQMGLLKHGGGKFDYEEFSIKL